MILNIYFTITLLLLGILLFFLFLYIIKIKKKHITLKIGVINLLLYSVMRKLSLIKIEKKTNVIVV